MNFNEGKYKPKVVQETIVGKDVVCNICGVDKIFIDLEVGNRDVINIISAHWEIDTEGYWWELEVVVSDGNSPIITLDKVKECIVTNLNLMDNFHEQILGTESPI